MFKKNFNYLFAICMATVLSCDFFKKNGRENAESNIVSDESVNQTDDRFRDCINKRVPSPAFSIRGKPVDEGKISPDVLNIFRQEQLQSYYQLLSRVEESSLSLLNKAEESTQVQTFADAYKDDIKVTEADKAKYLDEAIAKGQLLQAQRSKLSQETVHQIVATKKREDLLTKLRQAVQSEMIDVVIDRPCVSALPLRAIYSDSKDVTKHVHIFIDLFNARHRDDVIQILDKTPEKNEIFVHFASHSIEGPYALAAKISHCARSEEKESDYRSIMRKILLLPLEMRTDPIQANKSLRDNISGKEELQSCIAKTNTITYAKNLTIAMQSLYFEARPEVFVNGVSYLWRSNRHNSIMEIQEFFRL